MANDIVEPKASFFNGWRIIGWSIPVILLILPAVAMRFTSEVDWGLADFVIMALLFATIGLGIEFLVRQSSNIAYRAAAVVALVTTFLTVWVNLAVGMIGDDDPYNLLFALVLLIALFGAILASFKPRGMAATMFIAAAVQAAAGAGGLAIDPLGAAFSIGFALPWMLSGGLFTLAARNA